MRSEEVGRGLPLAFFSGLQHDVHELGGSDDKRFPGDVCCGSDGEFCI